MSSAEIPGIEAEMETRFYNCANWLLNRIEGKRRRELVARDIALLSVSTVSETESAMVLACQAEGCLVQWAVSKNSDGTFAKEMVQGVSACPSN